MSASIWDPSDNNQSPKVSGDNTYKSQRFTNLANGQTLFNITEFAYVPNTSSLEVRVNGVVQFPGIDFTETSATSFTLTTGITSEDVVDVKASVGNDNSVAAAQSAANSAQSAQQSQGFRDQAQGVYDNIVALNLPSLPLVIENGGTGKTTAAAGFKALAPAPVKNKVIGSFDGATFAMMDPVQAGGNITNTGNVVLTETSECVQFITPNNHGQYVTLPDATKLRDKGANIFDIYNNSEFYYGIRDSSGNQLGWAPPRASVQINLADNANAAGVWVLDGIDKYAVTQAKTDYSMTEVSLANIKSIQIDANRICFLSSSANKIWGIVYDYSTNTWGNATTLLSVAYSGSYQICMVGGQLLIVYCAGNAGGNIAIYALSVAVAGTSLAPTPTSAVYSGVASPAMYYPSAIIAVNATTAAFVYTNGGHIIQTVTLGAAGTAPTISANPYTIPNTGGTDSGVLLYLTATANVILCLPHNQGTIKPTAVTINGLAIPTLVSQVSMPSLTGTASTTSSFKVLFTNTGRWLILYVGASGVAAALLSFAANVLSINGTNLVNISAAPITDYSELAVISDTKFIVVLINNNAPLSTVYAYNLVDTAGTLASYAATTFTITGTIQVNTVVSIGVVNNKASFWVANGSANSYYPMTFDVSANTPALISQQSMSFSTDNTGIPVPLGTDFASIRAANCIVSNNTVLNPVTTGANQVTSEWLYRISANSIHRVKNASLITRGKVVKGLKANEAWLVYGPFNTSSNYGVTFNRVELV